MKVLIVEDNEDQGTLYVMMLVGTDFEAATAKTLTEGIQTIQQEPFDIILLDLGLPDAGGVEAVKRLKALYPNIPIVVATGRPDIEAEVKAVGADEILHKLDISPRSLISTLSLVRGRVKSHRVFEKIDKALSDIDREIQERKARLRLRNP